MLLALGALAISGLVPTSSHPAPIRAPFATSPAVAGSRDVPGPAHRADSVALSSSAAPSNRSPALAYDPGDGYTLLFGGRDAAGYRSDTWTYHAGTWTEIFPAMHPSARTDAALTYDTADGYMLLFGGVGNSTLADTWAFRAGVWTELHPTHHPGPTASAMLTYDGTDGYVVLFGGYNPAQPGELSQTWTFRAGEWTQLNPETHPAGRHAGFLAYDRADAYVVLFGGRSASLAPGGGDYGDTWKFVDEHWSQLSPSSAPGAREAGTMAYDAVDGYAVLFGGANATTGSLYADTWRFSEEKWTVLSPATHPSSRMSAGMAFDTADGYVLLFGGSASASTDRPLGDSWVFAAGAWRALSAPVPPAPAGDVSISIAPPACGAVSVNGTRPANGSTVRLALGTYTVSAGACAGHEFERWTTTGAVSVSAARNASATVSIRGNGSLGALYVGSLGALASAGAVVATTCSPAPSATIRFSGSATAGVGPYSYRWDFGDGTPASLEPNVTHRFVSRGPFAVTLSVTDANGVRAQGALAAFAAPLPSCAGASTPSGVSTLWVWGVAGAGGLAAAGSLATLARRRRKR